MSSCLSSSEEELTGNKKHGRSVNEAEPNEKLFENWTEKNKLEFWTSKESTRRYIFKLYNHFNPSAETTSTLSQSNDIISWLDFLSTSADWLDCLSQSAKSARGSNSIGRWVGQMGTQRASVNDYWSEGLANSGSPSTANQWDPFSNPRLRHF